MIMVKNQKAFSMLTAIVVIVAMSVISMFVLSTASKTIKMTTDQYRKEQAMFYAKSYTEYAIMAVSADARVNNCVRNINARIDGGAGANSTGYNVRIRIFYIADNRVAPPICAANRVLSQAVEMAIAPNQRQTPLNIIVDAYVDYRDLNDMGHQHTYHRRSLQKI